MSGVVAMWECIQCWTLYSVSLTRCPRCHCREFKEGDMVPKITKHGGDSDATLETEGGEFQSVGTDYSISSESQLPSGEQPSDESTLPAQMMESPYPSPQETSDTADSVGGETSESSEPEPEPEPERPSRRRR